MDSCTDRKRIGPERNSCKRFWKVRRGYFVLVTIG